MNDQANPTPPDSTQDAQPSHWVDSIEAATARWPEEYRPQSTSPSVFGEVTNVANDTRSPSEIVMGSDDMSGSGPRPGRVLEMPTRPTFARFEEISGVASPVLERPVSPVALPVPEVFTPSGDHFEPVRVQIGRAHV